MTTFEAVCIILNQILNEVRTKRIVIEPELLNERICYEDCENIIVKNMSDFITAYAEGKYNA